MANVIEQLKVVLGLETKGFAPVRSQIKGFVEGTQKDLASLKSYAAGFFTVAFGKELYGTLRDRALDIKQFTRKGLDVEQVQRYEKAFGKVNLTVDDALRSFDMLLEKRKEALEKGGEPAQLFRAFGISEDELRNMKDGAAIFERIAAIANDPANAKQREEFLGLFGVRRGGSLLGAASELSKLKSFGMFSKEQIDAFAESSKAMKEATHEFQVAAMPLATALTQFAANSAHSLYGKGNEGKLNQKERFERANAIGDEAKYLSQFGKDKIQRAQSENLYHIARKVANSGNVTDQDLSILMAELTGIKTGRRVNAPIVDQPIATGPNSYNQAVAEAMGVPGGREAGPYSADRESQRERIQAAMDAAMFKTGNTAQRKRMLMEQMQRDYAEANRLEGTNKADDFQRASELRAGIVRDAADLANMNGTQHQNISPDAAAAIGGFIGGAAIANDPGLVEQRTTNDILRDMLSHFPKIEAALNGGQPIRGLQ